MNEKMGVIDIFHSFTVLEEINTSSFSAMSDCANSSVYDKLPTGELFLEYRNKIGKFFVPFDDQLLFEIELSADEKKKARIILDDLHRAIKTNRAVDDRFTILSSDSEKQKLIKYYDNKRFAKLSQKRTRKRKNNLLTSPSSAPPSPALSPSLSNKSPTISSDTFTPPLPSTNFSTDFSDIVDTETHFQYIKDIWYNGDAAPIDLASNGTGINNIITSEGDLSNEIPVTRSVIAAKDKFIDHSLEIHSSTQIQESWATLTHPSVKCLAYILFHSSLGGLAMNKLVLFVY